MTAQPNKPQRKNTNKIKGNAKLIAKSGTVRPREKSPAALIAG